MSAAARDLLPVLALGLVPTGVLVCLVGMSFVTGRPLLLALALLVAGNLLLAMWRGRWAWRFARQTRRFVTLPGRRVVLRYSPGLTGYCDPRDGLALAEEVLAGLEARFGGPMWAGLIRRRVRVFVFPSGESVQAVFGPLYSGIALAQLHAVVLPLGVPFDEWLRHELTHLFSHRWNPWAPPLLQEGLSVWLQRTERGYTIDGLAVVLLRVEDHSIRRLLDCEFFFAAASRYQCYVLAGSFTGFLIGRFGWEAYRKLYKGQQGGKRFDARFNKRFGVTLEEAEALWREDLRKRYESPGQLWMAGLEAPPTG